jgi:hypothetical protein
LIPKGLKKYDPIEIVWLDIIEQGGWSDKDKRLSNADMRVRQVGYFYRKDKEMLEIISSYFPKDKTVGVLTKIPLGTIKQIKRVRREK